MCCRSKPLPAAICISVPLLLSACSNFKRAYGGRMCLRATCASLPPCPPLQLFFFYLSAGFFSLRSSLHLTSCQLFVFPPCICLAYSSSHLPPAPPPRCIIVTRTSPEHAPASTRPCMCNQKMHKLERTDSKDHTHGLWRRWSASLLHSNTLRPCKAALPISGTLLRAVEFWRGKTSSCIHWLSTITHPSTCRPGSAQRVSRVCGALR